MFDEGFDVDLCLEVGVAIGSEAVYTRLRLVAFYMCLWSDRCVCNTDRKGYCFLVGNLGVSVKDLDMC